MNATRKPRASANPYKTIVDECTIAGAPTDKCCRIFSKIGTRAGAGGISRNEYWMAVREGTTRHRCRNRVSKPQLDEGVAEAERCTDGE